MVQKKKKTEPGFADSVCRHNLTVALLVGGEVG